MGSCVLVATQSFTGGFTDLLSEVRANLAQPHKVGTCYGYPTLAGAGPAPALRVFAAALLDGLVRGARGRAPAGVGGRGAAAAGLRLRRWRPFFLVF